MINNTRPRPPVGEPTDPVFEKLNQMYGVRSVQSAAAQAHKLIMSVFNGPMTACDEFVQTHTTEWSPSPTPNENLVSAVVAAALMEVVRGLAMRMTPVERLKAAADRLSQRYQADW